VFLLLCARIASYSVSDKGTKEELARRLVAEPKKKKKKVGKNEEKKDKKDKKDKDKDKKEKKNKKDKTKVKEHLCLCLHVSVCVCVHHCSVCTARCGCSSRRRHTYCRCSFRPTYASPLQVLTSCPLTPAAGLRRTVKIASWNIANFSTGSRHKKYHEIARVRSDTDSRTEASDTLMSTDLSELRHRRGAGGTQQGSAGGHEEALAW
jgi:hypothetical protein